MAEYQNPTWHGAAGIQYVHTGQFGNSTVLALMRADWIEHVIATDGDQYLKTPEHLLPWHVRAMLDVYLALAAGCGGLMWLILLGLRRLFFGRRPAPGSKAVAPRKAEGVKTYHVVASSQQGLNI